MSADQVATRDRVLTRRRIEQLRAVGLFPAPITRRFFQHFGPLAAVDRLCDETVPARPEMCDNDGWCDGDELGVWGAVMVLVEPDWHITERHGRWIVWEDWGHPWDAGDLNNQHWQSEELARRYLEVLTDNFWAQVHR